jgi:hypothetical protein
MKYLIGYSYCIDSGNQQSQGLYVIRGMKEMKTVYKLWCYAKEIVVHYIISYLCE